MVKLAMCYPALNKEKGIGVLVFSPLAFAYLASHTPEYYQIKLYDEHVGEKINPETVDADLVAVSAITSGIPRAYEIGDKLRSRGITCVIGGAHASALPHEALQHFDTIIIGEGEHPWKEFLIDFEKGINRKIYESDINASFNDLEIPDRRLIHPFYPVQSVNTSRGCPHRCSFCYLTVYKGLKYRTIPHDMVLEDFEVIKNNPLITITDANFIGFSNKDIEDRKILLEKMIRRNYKFLWGCQSTIKIADDHELMTLMKRAGCIGIFAGFESLETADLKEVNKKQNIGKDYGEIIKKIHKHKLGVIASCVIGLDSHKPGYHKVLTRKLKEIKVDFIDIKYLTAFPGTTLFCKLEKAGRVNKSWGDIDPIKPSIQFKHFTKTEILKERENILKSFFSIRNSIQILFRWMFVKAGPPLGLIIKMTLFRKYLNK